MTASKRKTFRRAPVSRRALTQRINRKLAASGEVLKLTWGRQAFRELGPAYTAGTHGVTRSHVDLERLGRELGALQDWEELIQK